METFQLLKYEMILHWIAVSFYVVSTVFFVRHVAFNKEKSLSAGLWLALIGLIPHSIALGVRWYAVGHGPYLEKMEAFSSLAYGAVVMFLVFSYKAPKLKSIGFMILPCCLLIMGVGFFSKGGIAKPPPTFHGVWFIIHTASIVPAVGAFLIALVTAILYLLKKKNREGEFYRKLPSMEVIDTYSYKFAGFGFIFWAIMVASGAIWAEQSWGRYWGWDPIETWSLITLLLLGLYMHLRRFFGWHGEKAAWLMIVCFLFSIITLFVIPFVMTTVHSEFLL